MKMNVLMSMKRRKQHRYTHNVSEKNIQSNLIYAKATSKSHPWDTTHEKSKKRKLWEPAKRKHFDLIDEGRELRLGWEVEKQKTHLWFRALAMKWLEAVPMHDDTTFLSDKWDFAQKYM